VQGNHADTSGDRNRVTGENATVDDGGLDNTVNGIPAGEERENRAERRWNRIQELQQRQLNIEESFELAILGDQEMIQLHRQMIELHRQINQLFPNLFQQQAPIQNNQEVQNNQVQHEPQLQRRSVSSPFAPRSSIKLTLRGNDEELKDDENNNDENYTEVCYCCHVKKAVVASVCCGKLATCLACTRKLYEGHLVGEKKCMNCQGVVEHLVRIS
jgi:hypothetical protein